MSWFLQWIAQIPIAVVVAVIGLIAVATGAIWLRIRRARPPEEEARANRAQRPDGGDASLASLPGPPAECPPADLELAKTVQRARKATKQSRREAAEHTREAEQSGLAEAEPDSLTTPAAPGRAAAAARPEGAVDLAALASSKPDPSAAEGALAIEAGRLAYQIPERMWVGVQEKVEVRLGALIANEFMQGFVGRGDVKLEDVPIVETMSVSLVCEPGEFDIEPRSQEAQLVKPDLVRGTAFHQSDFARWTWFVTPRQRGKHTLLVKVSAALRDSRGLPTTSSLPDKIIAVTVQVHFARAAVGAIGYLAPLILSGIVTALVGIITKDYWWPAIRPWLGL